MKKHIFISLLTLFMLLSLLASSCDIFQITPGDIDVSGQDDAMSVDSNILNTLNGRNAVTLEDCIVYLDANGYIVRADKDGKNKRAVFPVPIETESGFISVRTWKTTAFDISKNQAMLSASGSKVFWPCVFSGNDKKSYFAFICYDAKTNITEASYVISSEEMNIPSENLELPFYVENGVCYSYCYDKTNARSYIRKQGEGFFSQSLIVSPSPVSSSDSIALPEVVITNGAVYRSSTADGKLCFKKLEPDSADETTVFTSNRINFTKSEFFIDGNYLYYLVDFSLKENVEIIRVDMTTGVAKILDAELEEGQIITMFTVCGGEIYYTVTKGTYCDVIHADSSMKKKKVLANLKGSIDTSYGINVAGDLIVISGTFDILGSYDESESFGTHIINIK